MKIANAVVSGICKRHNLKRSDYHVSFFRHDEPRNNFIPLRSESWQIHFSYKQNLTTCYEIVMFIERDGLSEVMQSPEELVEIEGAPCSPVFKANNFHSADNVENH